MQDIVAESCTIEIEEFKMEQFRILNDGQKIASSYARNTRIMILSPALPR